MEIIEGTKLGRLFKENGFYMSFDKPEEGETELAMVINFNGEKEVMVMAIGVFGSDEDALEWFAEQRRSFAN
jgi:hypothetical protein